MDEIWSAAGRHLATGYFPWKTAFRFSRNARNPSFASAIAKRRFWGSPPRAGPFLIDISPPSATGRLINPTARAAGFRVGTGLPDLLPSFHTDVSFPTPLP